ncbi:Chloride channel protein 2 [Trichostrongylus colubriformis]|uniref:Chloride channel protein 2 n=1 Tax=Trichostrongylus colubriformis TaxID=6319 RepID=A0AAN8GCB9_TRICO
MNTLNSRSTPTLPNNRRTNIFNIGTDETETSEGEHLMYNAISSLSSIGGPLASQKHIKKRDQRVFLPISVDGFYLALLGVSTAICSLTMDFAIEQLQQWHVSMYNWVDMVESNHNHNAYTFIVWSGYAVVLVTSSAIFAHYFSPQTIGSGIPEMKTILRGFSLEEYLSFRTLISKMIGLTLSLGSGLPLGKEGPFVHVASALATQVSRFVTGVQGAYENESMSHELLAAGCAVGVACTFSTPIGGVLFSIEVTSAYFAVRNYWRGFFAAICAATTFRIVRLIVRASEVTVSAYYQTRFPEDAFLPEELPVFGLIGLMCGLAGALFIKCHRALVIWLHNSNIGRTIVQRNWLLYPVIVSFIVSSITYPKGAGQFLSGQHKFSQTLQMFFENCTWSMNAEHKKACPSEFFSYWTVPSGSSVLYTLSLFAITFFILSMLSSTLPIPAGIFMPVFVIGASFGRLMGESMAILFPEGIRSNYSVEIHPGVYAVVGAAAFCGSVTHTISVAVIVFELTGQLMHILPVMIAVLVGNVVCSYFQPSIYDSIIMTKSLPYIPDVSHCSHDFHTIVAENIMVSDVKFIWKDITYYEMKDVVEGNREIRAFPVVLDRESRILLGSVARKALSALIEDKVGERARQLEAARRARATCLTQDSREESSNSVEFHGEKEMRKLLLSRSKKSRSGPRTRRRSECLRLLHRGGSRRDDERGTARVEVGGREGTPALPSSHSFQRDPYRKDSLSGVLKRSMSRLVSKNRREIVDLSGEERATWEAEQLSSLLDLQAIHIDAAPFQLVENTSIFKIHSVFSLLGLRRAYVTKLGRLVGVVSLRELRTAIEDINHAANLGSTRYAVDNHPELGKHSDTLEP